MSAPLTKGDRVQFADAPVGAPGGTVVSVQAGRFSNGNVPMVRVMWDDATSVKDTKRHSATQLVRRTER